MLLDLYVGMGPVLAATDSDSDGNFGAVFLLAGFVFYGFMFLRLRNVQRRHRYERETEAEKHNVRATDALVQHRTGLTQPEMAGANHKDVKGARNRLF